MSPTPINLSKRSPLRFWLAVGFFVLALILLISAAIPFGLIQQVVKFPPVSLPTATSSPTLLEKRLIVLEWPEKLHVGDDASIELVLKMDPQGILTATITAAANGQPAESVAVNIPDIYATHNIVAIARLELAGVQAFRQEIQEPLLPGRKTAFRWRIRAGEAGRFRGVVWLHLDLVPKKGGPYERVLLLARPIEIETVTVFALSANLARGIGILGLVLSIILAFPFIPDGWKAWSKKRGKPSAR